MKVLIVLAHPERKSFNGGLVDVAIQQLEMAGHAIDVDDLYADQFDPVERAKHYAHHAFDDDYFYGSSSLGVEFPPELGQDMTSTTTGGTT